MKNLNSQVSIFDLLNIMANEKNEVKASAGGGAAFSSVDTTKRIFSLAREKEVREHNNDGYTDYISMGIVAKLGTIKFGNYGRLSVAENEIFKKLNIHFLNKYYEDMFKDGEEFTKAVEEIKTLVNDEYIFIENIVKDDSCSHLSRSKPKVRPVGLRIDIKDRLGYSASIYTNNTYTGEKLNDEYLGNKRNGYHLYFLKYNDIFPVFLYLKLLRDYLQQEPEISAEYNLRIKSAIEETEHLECSALLNYSKPICNFTGIDLLYSLKQFTRITNEPLTSNRLGTNAKLFKFMKRNRYNLYNYVNSQDLIYPILWDLMADYIKSIKSMEYEIERERVAKSDYAASYQDKKSTNKKYIDAAETSMLKRYFKKIEIDTDVDLKLFSEYEKQIAYFYELFGMSIDDLELRLRKLGKHKAAGLFFPHANCLCVDIKNPSSFVHEFFHAIDYNKGIDFAKCHNFTGFKHIYRLYTDNLDNSVKRLDKKDQLRNRLFGSSKYNIDYYKDPYEVFARCGEMYFHELYGDKYSIGKIELNESIFYPLEDEAMVSEINLFFDDLFKKFKEEVNDGKRVSGF